VLLHGIGTLSCAMNRIESALNADGHRMVNLPYPAREIPFGQIAGEQPSAPFSSPSTACFSISAGS